MENVNSQPTSKTGREGESGANRAESDMGREEVPSFPERKNQEIEAEKETDSSLQTVSSGSETGLFTPKCSGAEKTCGISIVLNEEKAEGNASSR